MPIQHAVLALLDDGPMYGYELKAKFEAAIGPQWGQLNIGHLYHTLDRLARDGLVTSKVEPAGSRPDRRVYSLTTSGRREVQAWLAEPAVRTGGYRDELFFKLLVASRSGHGALAGVVNRQRAHHVGELRTLAELRHEHADDPVIRLLIDAARLHNEANLRLLEIAEGEQADLSAAAHRAIPRGSRSRRAASSTLRKSG